MALNNTPETDAAAYSAEKWTNVDEWENVLAVDADFARQLERERDEARTKLAAAHDAWAIDRDSLQTTRAALVNMTDQRDAALNLFRQRERTPATDRKAEAAGCDTCKTWTKERDYWHGRWMSERDECSRLVNEIERLREQVKPEDGEPPLAPEACPHGREWDQCDSREGNHLSNDQGQPRREDDHE